MDKNDTKKEKKWRSKIKGQPSEAKLILIAATTTRISNTQLAYYSS
jgi:hypothetical protein